MHDAIIIGAGAAGLAAASILRESGLDIAILEARQRSGGRCWSVTHSSAPLPLELGAEFVHGSAEDTEKLAARAGVLVNDVAGTQWRVRGKRLTKQDDFFSRVGRVMSRLPQKGPDISFGEFLDGEPGGASLAQDRMLARSFVQGFHAADLDRISARALAEAGNPGEDESAARHGRTIGGYTALLAPLLHDVSDRIHYDEAVRRIQWERGHVAVETGTRVFEARAAIVTLSPGVLQSGDVVIDPLPRSLTRALGGIAMGSVARVTLLFDQRFWEQDIIGGVPANASLTDLSFLHTPQSPFNIWWTQYPLRTPVLVGWSGGPPGAKVNAEGAAERALPELAKQLGVTRRRLESMLVATFHHDWDADPFSRGAYSYAVVGGATASQRLARPIEGTLFIAGEATAAEHSGTVEGALKSGYRAARLILQARG
ncbi:MAG TPA: NAD(P)/FAD-dependent oxidoreductase [Longimicrobiales bacterium]|nr:NAD(P)/FAD-dependent oxidoreductase [Longimicrobiales bacterium]